MRGITLPFDTARREEHKVRRRVVTAGGTENRAARGHSPRHPPIFTNDRPIIGHASTNHRPAIGQPPRALGPLSLRTRPALRWHPFHASETVASDRQIACNFADQSGRESAINRWPAKRLHDLHQPHEVGFAGNVRGGRDLANGFVLRVCIIRLSKSSSEREERANRHSHTFANITGCAARNSRPARSADAKAGVAG